MRRIPTILIATAILLGSSSTAGAHELQVLSPGSAELDLGLLSRELLVHATLQDADDTLRITLQAPAEGQWQVQVLLPDAQPERSASVGSLPDLSIVSAGTRARAVFGELSNVRDEVTGVRYLGPVADEGMVLDPGRRLTLLIECGVGAPPSCGKDPTRVAVRVFSADGVGFAAQDIDRTRTSVARVVEWASSGAQDSSDGASGSGLSPRLVAWFGAGLATIGVLTALWWVARGRRTSRVRGAERAAEERAAAEEIPRM